MPRISQTAQVFTLVNSFTVAEGRQDELIALLSAATDDFISACPGFISTTFHRGADGKTVVNYAQWEARRNWKAMLATKKAKLHVAEVQAMIEGFQSTPCVVAKVHGRRKS